ncbi:G protein coupled receptor bride of sevenless isoform 1-T1 [Glossina fuscipes fuscipes]
MSWKYRKINIQGQQEALFCLMLMLCSIIYSGWADETFPNKITFQKITQTSKLQAKLNDSISKSTSSIPVISSTETSNISTDTSNVTNLFLISSTTEASDASNPNTNVSNICSEGIKSILSNSEDEKPIVKTEREIVQVLQGEVMLSILTTDPISAMFVVNRLNVANLLEADFEIGVRAIQLDGEQSAQNLLLQEIQYQQQCLTHSLGIFIDYDYFKMMAEFIKELEYRIWPISSIREDIFPKVAHLLYQMPWGDQIASVEILSETLQIYNDFTDAVRREHMCLMHFKSDNNIYILFGNKMAMNFKENGTIFAVPTERTERGFIADLPDRSYILMENEINLKIIDQNSTQITLDEPLVGKTILSSRVLALSRPLLKLMRWFKSFLEKHCRRFEDLFILESCTQFLEFIDNDWMNSDRASHQDTAELLDLFRMRRLTTLMNFQMFQKHSAANADVDLLSSVSLGDDHLRLREIASQNFVTNITTYYHYNQDNQTSVELKTKFGKVFNCQYSAAENPRHPFLFDGDSVMFWRIKPETWVATGMTAAILGVICTLAILVFIIVRISLGDVFEGNPVTSILLLLSLLLMFTSFVPFSMEYVGEQRNSHVTFEDLATLNTLCAVRIFILTLIYCFVFCILLCRAVMLASIGSEGGFLSHVNGYIQAVVCIFSVLVQLGMSIQLLVVMHIASDRISCENIYYGNWLFGLLSYDALLLLSSIALIPFIYRSQRNYREGILIVIGCVLILIIWIAWITISFFGDDMRDAAIPLGLQACGWAALVGILIPRTFLIVRGIERSDIAQALPSLTSLAFAQNNQYSSEQSVYECVNPAMRNCQDDESHHHHHQSPSEIPTLPLRGGGPRRQQMFANLRQTHAVGNGGGGGMRRQNTTRVQRGSPTGSCESSLPPSPENSKITRF